MAAGGEVRALRVPEVLLLVAAGYFAGAGGDELATSCGGSARAHATYRGLPFQSLFFFSFFPPPLPFLASVGGWDLRASGGG